MLGALPLGIEERRRHDTRGRLAATMLHRHLHPEGRAWRRMARLEVRQGDVALEQRRPATTCRVPDLLLFHVERDTGAERDGGELRRQTAVSVQPLQRGPVDLDAGE